MAVMKFQRPRAELCNQAFDVIVIGGGITGAGIAQDAASRGLKTILLEKGDFASGTSSKSTKLIHGGLRYLENLQFRVTLESVRERQLQQQVAPHMVWSLPFVIPAYEHNRLKNLKLGAGLWLYDLMALGFGNRQRHQALPAKKILSLCPGINAAGLTGGYVFYDCRTDDARHTLEVIKSACDQGAIALNHTKVVGLLRENGRISGVRIVDNDPTRQENANQLVLDLRGHVVVNATGVWTQSVLKLGAVESNTEVLPAKGIHITLPKARLPIEAALLVPSVYDRRFCFAIPWYDCIVIGTTDTEYRGDLDNIKVESHEISYLLDAVNNLFPQAKITDKDVTGWYAGLRPLIREIGKTSTADLSREHHLEESSEGLISISGGKLTTYRRMAKETIDLVSEKLGREHHVGKIGSCVTDKLMLGGWERGDDVAGIISVYEQMALSLNLSADTARYLPHVYGKGVLEIFALLRQNPNLCRKLSPNHPYIAAQVVHAVHFEGALTLDDFLARRIRLAITDRKAALSVLPKVAQLMAEELNWSTDQKSAQVSEFLKEWE